MTVYKYRQAAGEEAERLEEFDQAESWGDGYVAWTVNGYPACAYADSGAGEYFTADPDGTRLPGYGQPQEDVLTDALSALDVLGVDTGAVENGGDA